MHNNLEKFSKFVFSLFLPFSEQNGAAGDRTSTDFERRINEAVFPGLQGGPHNNSIAAIAVALREAATPEFRSYQKQILANMQHLCAELTKLGYKVTVLIQAFSIPERLLSYKPLIVTVNTSFVILFYFTNLKAYGQCVTDYRVQFVLLKSHDY